MTTLDAAPQAFHIGADDLPFVEIGGGNKLKVLQVKPEEGLWIIENIFQAGFEVQTHRHTGPVFGYTTSGAWKYKEYDYVNRAGSFLYEPAGSVHTLQCIEDDTQVWFQMYGVNLNLDAEGNMESVSDGAGSLAAYVALVRGPGVPAAQRVDRVMAAAVDLADPDTFVHGPPHEALAELRQSDPVHFCDMDDGGFWAVLKHADVVKVAKSPGLFSASEGGVVIETLAPEQVEAMRGMLLAMDPPRHLDYRRPMLAHFGRLVIGRMEDQIRGVCADIMDKVDTSSEVEFVHDVTADLPSRVIGTLMGLPEEDWGRIHEMAERNTSGQDADYASDAGAATMDMAMYAIALAQAPPDRASPRPTSRRSSSAPSSGATSWTTSSSASSSCSWSPPATTPPRPCCPRASSPC